MDSVMETTMEKHSERHAADNADSCKTDSTSGSFIQRFQYIGVALIFTLTVLVIVFALLLLMSENTLKISESNAKRQNADVTPQISSHGVEAKQMIEDSLERRAQDLLVRLIGPGRAIVTINADIDMEVVKRVRGTEDTGSALLSSRNKEATAQDIVTEYIQAPGEIRRLSVSVIVDGSYSYDKSGKKVFIPVSESELRNIEAILKQALGFDETRDDTIAITSMPLVKETHKSSEDGITGNHIFKSLPVLSVMFVTVLVLIITGFIYLKRKFQKEQNMTRVHLMQQTATNHPAELKNNSSAKSLIAENQVNDKTRTAVVENCKEVDNGPFATLNHVDTSILSDYLKGEHPQTIAVVLSHLPGSRSARILASMPEKIQGEVVLRMANMGVIPKVVIDELDQVLKRDIEAMGAYDGRKLGGVEYVANIMNHLEINTENIIFASLEDADPLLADRIRQKMFVFEDIMDIDNRGIQTLLKEITNEDLLLALKTANDELKEKIFSNMSNRAAEMLKEDMESLGPVRVADVETAQQNIIRIARKLERLGRLVIAGKGREDVLV
jgi:flagellar motor switch protein FliG